MTKNALVVGGSNGVGAAITLELLKKEYDKIYIADIANPCFSSDKIEFIRYNVGNSNSEELLKLPHINTLIITVGVGRLDYFDNNTKIEIKKTFQVNTLGIIDIIHSFYDRINSNNDFYCAVMSSIAGLVSSPLYAVYSASKAAISRFIESINAELAGQQINNRILSVAPGKIEGTKFHGGDNDLNLLEPLAEEIISLMFDKKKSFIPNFEVYGDVLHRYQDNPDKFGIESYQYKIEKNALEKTRKIKIGYLTGSFDFFHIGHLNIIKRAKEYCDYLIVGVHKDGSHKSKELSLSLNDRINVVQSCCYVDEVVVCTSEDTDAYEELKYDYLFVGSDYQGTERFNRYENELIPKGVKIIYFPYTKGISSTKIREIENNK